MPRLISAFGLFAMIFLAWLMSSRKGRFPWRVMLGGVALQFAFAVLLLKGGSNGNGQGTSLAAVGRLIDGLIGHVDVAAAFLFGAELPRKYFAFKVLPTIIFFSALTSMLYHLGILQRVVQALGWVMQKSLGTSGAESLSAAANIFVGQTEAPLVVRPYLQKMTDSEIMAVMVGGYATIAGGVMAAYIQMGIDAGHLLTASLISAPAALVVAKIMQPEVDRPATLGFTSVELEKTSVNVLDAVTNGATDGAKLAINIAAMLIAFLALIALADTCLGHLGTWFGQTWSMALFLGYAFAPFAWLMGVESADVLKVGELIGLRTASNEFIAYEKLAEWLKPESGIHLSERSVAITTYALCGFANLSSVGIQIGGLSTLAPGRRSDFARLAFRAMLGGTLACFMTACIAGILL